MERCLAALTVQTRPPDEVLVIGRAEDSAARAVVTQHGALLTCPLLWLEVVTAGHVPPIRRGIERTSSAIVSFLDDDTEPDPEWLEALLRLFDDQTIACVGGRVVTPGREPIPTAHAGRLRWYGKYVGNLGCLETVVPVDVDGLPEGNCAWRVDVLRRLEFSPVLSLDDSLHYGLDLCLQAKQIGYRVVYTSEARVRHHLAPRDGAVSRADAVTRSFILGRNLTYVGLKRYSIGQRIAFLFWWFAVGERQSYGALKAIWDLPQGRAKVLRLLKSAFTGRLAGIQAWVAQPKNVGSSVRR